jgi:hypothetical protein
MQANWRMVRVKMESEITNLDVEVADSVNLVIVHVFRSAPYSSTSTPCNIPYMFVY